MPLAKTIAQAVFKRMAPELVSAGKMIRAAKRLGGSYRYTDMLEDIRAYTGRAKYQVSIERLSGNKVVPKAWMVETSLKEPGANYRVFGKATVIDLRTGIEDQQVFSFYHTDLMQKSDYAREFSDYFVSDSIDPEMEFITFDITAIEHNEGMPY